MFNNVANSAPLRIEPWWQLPLLLVAITVEVTASIWMIRLKRRSQ